MTHHFIFIIIRLVSNFIGVCVPLLLMYIVYLRIVHLHVAGHLVTLMRLATSVCARIAFAYVVILVHEVVVVIICRDCFFVDIWELSGGTL